MKLIASIKAILAIMPGKVPSKSASPSMDERYRRYLLEYGRNRYGFFNSHNLFYDFNLYDRRSLKRARKFIKRASGQFKRTI